MQISQPLDLRTATECCEYLCACVRATSRIESQQTKKTSNFSSFSLQQKQCHGVVLLVFVLVLVPVVLVVVVVVAVVVVVIVVV